MCGNLRVKWGLVVASLAYVRPRRLLRGRRGADPVGPLGAGHPLSRAPRLGPRYGANSRPSRPQPLSGYVLVKPSETSESQARLDRSRFRSSPHLFVTQLRSALSMSRLRKRWLTRSRAAAENTSSELLVVGAHCVAIMAPDMTAVGLTYHPIGDRRPTTGPLCQK